MQGPSLPGPGQSTRGRCACRGAAWRFGRCPSRAQLLRAGTPGALLPRDQSAPISGSPSFSWGSLGSPGVGDLALLCLDWPRMRGGDMD